MNFLLDYLFPRDKAAEELYALSPAELLLRLPRSTHEGPVITLFEYAYPLTKDLIWEIKYKGSQELAKRVGVVLYDTLVSELEEEHFGTGKVLLLPMPMSDKRRLERGWNQAELLAEALNMCDNAGRFEYLRNALEKVRHTESQTIAGSRAERLLNLKDSMAARDVVLGRTCVVVDDVSTTGATFAEAKRALALARARKVICLAIAH